MLYDLALSGRSLTARRLFKHDPEHLFTDAAILRGELPKRVIFRGSYRPSLALSRSQVARLQARKRVFVLWFWPNETAWAAATILNALALAALLSAGLTAFAPIFAAALLTLLAFAATSAQLGSNDAPLLRMWLIYLCGIGLALPYLLQWWPEMTTQWSRISVVALTGVGVIWIGVFTLLIWAIAFFEAYDERRAARQAQ